MAKQANSVLPNSKNKAEVAQFDAIGGTWWDEQGPFKPLHMINPVRLGYLRDQIAAHYPGIQNKNLKLLDIGCGGGLLCEPLARQGFQVTGLDASPMAITTATAHAADGDLNINYICGAVEDMNPSPGFTSLNHPQGRVRSNNKFDIITALEIIEHVNNPAGFVASCAQLLKPGGLMIFSTLNRTVKSLLLGKIAAEYILCLVPAGTHDWKKFVKPGELAAYVRAAGLTVADVTGLVFNPAAPNHVLFSVSKSDVAVNYFMKVIKTC